MHVLSVPAGCAFRGVWAPEEYRKLPAYDADTPYQPARVFLCHQTSDTDARCRVCAGWAGCHDGEHLLALRIAAMAGSMTPEAVEATMDYVSPVRLWDSGAEAAAHGLAQVDDPGGKAVRTMRKIAQVRGDLATRKD